MVQGLHDTLGQAGIGSVSEIFDAEAPFTPRGCIAQAWSVAELIRAAVAVAWTPGPVPSVARIVQVGAAGG